MSKPCGNCGAEVPEGANICDNCGMPVSEGEPHREAPAREAPAHEAPPARKSTVSPPPGEAPLQGAPPRRRGPLSEDPARQRPPAPPPPMPPPRTISTPERQPAPSRREERSRGRLLVLAGGLAVALLALGAAVWFLVPYLGGGGDTLEVPSLEGRTLEEARRLADGDFEVVGDGGTRGVVESQDPAPGERARRGAEISVVLGGGEAVALPDVVGRSRAEAEELLRSEGFEVRVGGSEDGEVLEQSPSGDEAEEGSTVEISVGEPRPASGYTLVSDDTGALTLEVPVGWSPVTGTASEGAGPGWSSFLGEDLGTSVTAAPDLDAWHNIAVSTGMYVVASRTLAEGYADEEIVVSGPNDFSAICTLGEAKDFERPPYQARIQAWKDCNGDPESFLLAVAVAPEDRECVVVMQFGTASQTDRDVAQHIIDTFEVDCGGIAGSVNSELADASEQVPVPAPVGAG